MGLSRFREWCGFRETHELPRQLAEDMSGGGYPLETERLQHQLLLFAHLTLSVSFSQGHLPSSAARCGSSRCQPLPCSLPPAQVRFQHAGDSDWTLQLSELSRKNPLTQHPSWAVCLHWGFSAEESRGGLPCSVFNRNQAKPNPQNKASKLTSDTSDLYSLHLTVTQLGLLPLLILSSLMQSPVLLFPPQEQCKFFLLSYVEKFFKIYLFGCARS